MVRKDEGTLKPATRTKLAAHRLPAVTRITWERATR
jgi:hypothetical protein